MDKQKRKEYYENNKKEIIEKQKMYYQKNKNRLIEMEHKRHNKIMFGGNKEIVLERDDFKCQNCGLNQEQHIVIYGYGLVIHHIDGNGKNSKIPNNDIDNLITLCRSCHTSHHNKERIGNKNPSFKHGKFVNRKTGEEKIIKWIKKQ